MASELQKILRSLCCNTGWCYAVFWRLQQQMHNLLAWEEAFYEPIKSLEMPEGLSPENQHFHPEDRIRQTVERMSCHVYSVGEGIVGRVAFTNKHQWIFSSKEREYPTELYGQFAAGIQTIAVISVHLGVVQLGSTQMISEDLKFVVHIKELFGALHNMEGIADNSSLESQRDGIYGMDSYSTTIAASKTARMPAISDVWSSLAARGRHLKDEQGLHELYSPLQSRSYTTLGLERSLSMSSSSPSHQQQDCTSSQKQPGQPLLHEFGSYSPVQYSSPSLTSDDAAMAKDVTGKTESSLMVGTINHLSFDVTPPTMIWPRTSRDSLQEKSSPLLQNGFTSQLGFPNEAFAAGGAVNLKSSGRRRSRDTTEAQAQNLLVPAEDSALLMQHSCIASNETMLNEAINLDSSTDSNCNSQSSVLDVQTFNLLDYQDLGEIMFSERNLGQDEDLSSLLCENVQYSVAAVHKERETCPAGPFDDALQRVFSSELNEFDNFLASLKKEQEKQDESIMKSPYAPTLSEEVSEISSRSIQKASFWDPPVMQGSLQSALEGRPVAAQPFVYSSKLKQEINTSCQTVNADILHLESFWKRPRLDSLYRTSESSTTPGPHDQIQSLSASMQGEHPQAGKKRVRLRENAKPRPKDRQQIQDRVRELRSIIPSSAKCSIDALLEKTIKYMSFLQAVTEDADKWKDGKLQDYERHGDSNIIEGGASWAVELGGQGRGCPLIVEDLSQPQHMLVEMLCEETGIFLEIADTIRGLGLTILKGIMEARNEKTWAHFVVKADEGVHRVHVLWSLMQLLESSTRNSSNITNLACG